MYLIICFPDYLALILKSVKNNHFVSMGRPHSHKPLYKKAYILPECFIASFSMHIHSRITVNDNPPKRKESLKLYRLMDC